MVDLKNIKEEKYASDKLGFLKGKLKGAAYIVAALLALYLAWIVYSSFSEVIFFGVFLSIMAFLFFVFVKPFVKNTLAKRAEEQKDGKVSKNIAKQSSVVQTEKLQLNQLEADLNKLKLEILNETSEKDTTNSGV